MNQNSKQVVFITGASSGIGAALAQEYAKQGCNLVLAARRLDKLLVTSESCQMFGAQVLIVKCDVTQASDLEHALKESLNRFGKIDTLIANAGFGVAGPLSKLQLEDYRRQFETNVFAVINSVKIILPEIIKNKGRIAIVGSVNGFIALGEGSPYAMSKFAVRAFADSLYFELKAKGVSVTHIAPGFVKSEIRLVNNKGEFREHAKDPVPAWIQMSAEKAAQDIYKAIQKRKPQAIITFHGKFLVFIRHHFPRFFRFVISRLRVKGRSEPKFNE